MNLDESTAPPDPAAPTRDELERAADQLADVYRAAAKAAQEPMTLKFGRKSGKLSRNSPCPCGSGRKYKVCCKQKVNQGQYQRLTIDGPVDPGQQPATVLGPSKPVRKYIRRKIAERMAKIKEAEQAAAKQEREPDAS
jgi:hypothetical protein